MIIPVLIKYIKWFDETQELDTIVASIEIEENEGQNSPSFTSKLLNITHIASSENSNTDVTISILWAISFLPERQICKM